MDMFNSNNIAEVKLIYSTRVKPNDRLKIQSSKQSFEVFKQTWNHETIELKEEMKVMLLNHGHRMLGIYKLSEGGVSGTVADPKLIFAAAIKSNSSAIILAHNHPSGNTQPSQADIQLTKRCREIGDLLEVKVLDHIIVTTDGYLSFADEGIM